MTESCEQANLAGAQKPTTKTTIYNYHQSNPMKLVDKPREKTKSAATASKKKAEKFQRIITILFMCFLQSRDSISATSLPEHALSLSRCLFDMFHGYLPGKNYNGVEC